VHGRWNWRPAHSRHLLATIAGIGNCSISSSLPSAAASTVAYTDATTMLHVPEIGLLVAGDVVFNGVHLYSTESGGVTGIDVWLAALDTAEALNPATVIAGHKDPRAFDNPSQISGNAAVPDRRAPTAWSSESAGVFYEAMLRLHPNRLNPGALWGAANTLFPTA